MAGSRLFVEKKIFDKVVEGVAGKANRIRVGPGLDVDTPDGAACFRRTTEAGLRLHGIWGCGGSTRNSGREKSGGKGYFVQPTVLINTRPDMKVIREEIFGPVVAATPFTDPEEVLAAANDSFYGLAAAVWTRGFSKVHQLAARLKAGTIWVNCYNVFDAALPFGGYKQSGRGREMGKEVFSLYTETKSVCLAL